jgi:hypothetical protein
MDDTSRVARVAAAAMGRVAQLAAGAFAAVLLAVEAVIAWESWRGLTGFAGMIGIHHVAAWGVPVTLDGVAMAAALIALVAELTGESSGRARVTLFVFTGASAAANWWHGELAGGIESALYFGGLSLAVAWVFTLVLRQIRLGARRRAGLVTDRLPRFSAAHWLRFPRLTYRAWSLTVRDGYPTARAALDAAAEAGEPEPELPEVPPNGVLAALPKADAIRIALAHNDGRVLAAQQWLADRGVTADRAYMHDVKRGASGRGRRNREVPALTTPEAARLVLSGGPSAAAAFDLLRQRGIAPGPGLDTPVNGSTEARS